MTDSPIEQAWQETLRENDDFCCPVHCEIFRMMFYAGAMAAFAHTANWTPDAPECLFLTAAGIEDVRRELTEAFHVEPGISEGVRH